MTLYIGQHMVTPPERAALPFETIEFGTLIAISKKHATP